METTTKEEFTKVQRVRDNKYNCIDANGKLLSDKWFEWIGDFYDGFAVVVRGLNKHNFIGEDGKILSEEWFKWADYFKDGFARVQREDSKWNFINTKGKLMSNEWFKYISYAMYSEYSFAYADRTNGECCKIDKNGKIVVSK